MRCLPWVGMLLASGGCAADREDRTRPGGPSAPTTDTIAGGLHIEAGRLSFIPCGPLSPIRVIDGTNGDAASLVRELAGDDGRLTAVVHLRGDTLLAIRYAGLEGPSCEALPPAEDFIASGTEPFWHVRIAGDSAVISSPEVQDGRWYRGGRWDARTFTAVGEPGDTLVVRLREERCADGMSGARYPWRATVWWQGRAMEGCALEGRGA